MNFPKYSYKLSDEKYKARENLFKYLIGIYTALIAASLVGFEKAMLIVASDVISPKSIEFLRLSVLALVLSIIQALLVLALSYHHVHYHAIFLQRHQIRYGTITVRWRKTLYGFLVWLEHILAVIETGAVILLAATWYVLPLLALWYLAMAYQEVLF